jgi:outer membrane lipoprotein SlyB
MHIDETRTRTQRYAKRRHRYEVGAGAVGALSGAGLGALAAGPPGAAVGALIGAGVGALAAWANHTGTEEAADRDSQLDLEIGVTGDELGTDPRVLQGAPNATSDEANAEQAISPSAESPGVRARPPV